MDWSLAIHYARMIQTVKDVVPGKPGGTILTIALEDKPVQYTVLASIFANDLATKDNKARQELIAQVGYIAQDEDGNVAIAFRGTHGIHEWLHDCRYFAVPCPFLVDAGNTEDGFTEMYMSLRTNPQHGSPSLRDFFKGVSFPRQLKSLTLCGHSLGASLATLLALDLAANTQYKDLSLYTFASPRTGDNKFAEVFNKFVPKTYRIANHLDLVTEFPPAFLSHVVQYRHVEATSILESSKQGASHHIVCMHCLTNYIHLMTTKAELSSGKSLTILECCRP